MAIIHILNTNGKGSATGDINVNSANIAANAKVAGTDEINAEDLKTSDWFNVTSAAAANNVVLNDDIEVGSSFVVWVGANGCQLIGGGAGKLNNGTVDQIVPLAANCRVEVTKMATNVLTVEQVTVAGARTNPTPAADS